MRYRGYIFLVYSYFSRVGVIRIGFASKGVLVNHGIDLGNICSCSVNRWKKEVYLFYFKV